MPEKILSGEFELGGKSSSQNTVNPSENKDKTIIQTSQSKTISPKKHAKSTSHFFSSFGYYPKNIRFQNQEKEEEIILLIRRRFIVNLPWIAISLLLAIIGPFIVFLSIASLPINPITPVQNFSIIAFYYLLILGFVIMKFTLWYFHVGLVTNKRIKDIDIHGVLFKDVAEARIDQIQDVSFTQIGFIPSLFNYGDIFVQTAGANPNIEFDRAPEPTRIAQIINDLLKQ